MKFFSMIFFISYISGALAQPLEDWLLSEVLIVANATDSSDGKFITKDYPKTQSDVAALSSAKRTAYLKEVGILVEAGLAPSRNVILEPIHPVLDSGVNRVDLKASHCASNGEVLVKGERTNIFKYTMYMYKERIVTGNQDEQCRNKMLKLFLQHKYLTRKKLESYCLSNPCELITRYLRNESLIIYNTLREVEEHSNISYEALACLQRTKQSLADEFHRLLKQAFTVKDCVPLVSSGESKLIKTSLIAGTEYLLTKKSNDGYKVTLNINFQKAPNATSSVDMNRRAQECVAKYSEHLKDPSGRSLEIEILDSNVSVNFVGTPKPTTINVFDDYNRYNALNYDSKIPCDVIVHELLHLVGLVDEYKERKEDYACRSHSSKKSIMAHQRFIRKIIKKSSSGKKKPILRTAHMEKIIQGNCNVGAIKKYNRCTRTAYLTTEQCEAVESIPAYCSDEKQWLDLE